MDIEVAAKLFVEGGHQMQQAATNFNKAVSSKPIHKMVGSSIASSGPGPDFLVIQDSPVTGRVWNVLSLQVFGDDDHTTLSGGSCVFYSSASDIIAAPGPLIDAISGPQAIPSTLWLSRLVCWVQPQEQIQAIVYGVPAGHNLSIVCNVDEYPVEANEAMSA